jgi:hypothetical protein
MTLPLCKKRNLRCSPSSLLRTLKRRRKAQCFRLKSSIRFAWRRSRKSNSLASSRVSFPFLNQPSRPTSVRLTLWLFSKKIQSKISQPMLFPISNRRESSTTKAMLLKSPKSGLTPREEKSPATMSRWLARVFTWTQQWSRRSRNSWKRRRSKARRPWSRLPRLRRSFEFRTIWRC